MTASSTIVVIGFSPLTPDEDEVLRDLGRAIGHVGKQLVTTKAPGVASAVTAGFKLAGHSARYLKKGEEPEASADVVVIADNEFLTKLAERVPDYQDKDWLVVHRNDIFDFHLKMLQVLSEQGRPLPSA